MTEQERRFSLATARLMPFYFARPLRFIDHRHFIRIQMTTVDVLFSPPRNLKNVHSALKPCAATHQFALNSSSIGYSANGKAFLMPPDAIRPSVFSVLHWPW